MSEVLTKAFTLLNFLKPRDGCSEWGAAELARMAGLNHATTHRILQDMVKFGVVGQNHMNKKFHLGPALVELGFLAGGLFSIRDVVRPFMDELSSMTRESIYLNIVVNEREALVIDAIDSDHQLRIVEPLGLRLPLHIGAMRRVILAFLNKEKQEDYFAHCAWIPRTKNTLTNEADVRKDMEKIREQGYAISFGETTIGTAGISVPIFGADGVEGSISIVTPDTRMNEEKIEEYTDLLLKKSRIISDYLGGGIWLTRN